MTKQIDARLARLPAKSSAPFRQLLATGHITEDIVTTVLDAGQLAGDTSKLVGFAVGFLFLSSQGIPVRDVINMAKQHKRRINLAWSANRWTDEHDKLSRIEALQRMAAENVTYDLSRYERHLPTNFTGYLIRNSRRLGMEGLRQRHCVASYHDHIKSESCAIATVFINKQRWTVELALTGDKKAPLRIAQIKTRHNGLPTAPIRQQIHHQLGVELVKPSPSSNTLPNERCLYIENLRRVLPVLRQTGVENVTVSFDGSGDNGAIEDIAFGPDIDRETLDVLTVQCLKSDQGFDNGQWQSRIVEEQASINDAIKALTNDYLDETDVNWYDNDGGFGDLIIDVTHETVSLNIDVRYTTSETEFSATKSIATGEDI